MERTTNDFGLECIKFSSKLFFMENKRSVQAMRKKKQKGNLTSWRFNKAIAQEVSNTC